MAREVAISIYLVFFRLLFSIFKLFPQKEKTVCVASFGDNIHYSTRSLRSLSGQEIIYLKDRSCSYPFDSSIGTIIPFTILRPIAYIRSIYHLATATTILADNYVGFFAATRFKQDTLCIQLWHAVGSLKQFGLMDPSNGNRSNRAMKRFKRVYNTFDYTIIGSEKMGTIFKENFGVSNDRLRRTGIPRTDLFYNNLAMDQIRESMYERFPHIQDKKVILYTPTFRKDGSQADALDIEALYEALGDEYVVLMKQHPSIKKPMTSAYKDFVYDVSDYYDVNHLLLITDILITDYSSIPFEFALLQKPMFFFAYDLKDYRKQQGVSQAYDEQLPGPIVYTTNEIINVIQKKEYSMDQIASFAKTWNTYSNGNSSSQIAKLIHNKEHPVLSKQAN